MGGWLQTEVVLYVQTKTVTGDVVEQFSCRPASLSLCDLMYRVGQKKRCHRLMTITLSIPNRFKNLFHWKFPW